MWFVYKYQIISIDCVNNRLVDPLGTNLGYHQSEKRHFINRTTLVTDTAPDWF